MKKILSLVLALLMLGTLAVSAGAAGEIYTFSDLLEFYNKYNTEKNPYEDLGDYLAGGYYTRWMDSCPKCSGLALFRTEDYEIKYTCLESKCGATGSYDISTDDDDKPTEETPDGVLTIECAQCGRIAKYAGKVTLGTTTYYGYLCAKNHETFKAQKDVEIDWDEIELSPIVCSVCKRNAEFESTYTYLDKVYGRYSCIKGHKTYKVLAEDIIKPADKEYYRVYVTMNGSGTYAIEGGAYARYGEVKTVKFTPSKGYILSRVTVNGEAVDIINNKVSFKVTDDTAVRATFIKYVKDLNVTASVTGNGTIKATYGSKTVDADKITVGYGDKITYKFVPASANYAVSSLKVNGKAVAISNTNTYTLSGITADTKIAVTFAWKSPYADVTSKYSKAVEYVTEAGIMGAVAADGSKLLFQGASAVSEKTFAAALAEMADVDNKLSTTAERIVWAEKYGLVKADSDLSVTCTVQTAAKMVDTYLSVLEELNDIDFDKYDEYDSVKDNAVSIGMVTAKTFDNNRKLTRYDLAAVCRLIANLEYDD